ncbi:MAG: hypothetical protein AAF957_00340 [Planctomycetota bacterium]
MDVNTTRTGEPMSAVERVRRREGWMPLVATVVLAVLGLAGWQAFAVGRIPEPVMHPNRFDGVIYWVGPRLGPFYAKQDVDSADLMFVGDSRVYDDIDLDQVRIAGEPGAGLIWGPNADLSILLPAVERLPMTRMVVALSPSTLGAKTNPVMRASLVEPPPEFDSLSLESALSLWTADERGRLIDEGYSPLVVDTHLSRFRKVLRETTLRGHGSTRELDRHVRERLNYFRTSNVRTLATRRWHREWFEKVDPDRLVIATRNTLDEITDEQRDRAEATIVASLRDFVGRGIEVHCVRFPVSPTILELEREYVSDERLRAIAEAAGVPFHEFHERGLAKGETLADRPDGFETRDGSHLTWPASRRFTRLLVETIRGERDG